MSTFMVEAKSIQHNPSAAELREMVASMPNATKTSFGAWAVKIDVKARSKASTYIVSEDASAHSDQIMSRKDYDIMAHKQNAYIAQRDMLAIDGYIGPSESTRTAVRLYIEKSNANIAAMQQQLYFSAGDGDFEPELNVIYTPKLKAEGYPKDRLIAVDLDNKVTRVFNSDYFGESKKGGLRMWNKLMHDKGGLALHAGSKEIPVDGKRKIALIIGLSGTGKTTTTFTKQNGSRPLQDDFVAWLADGSVVSSEAGCFAKTFGLNAKSEPMIHAAVTQAESYLENVAVSDSGETDFFDDSYTQNGRATFPLSMIPEAGDVADIPSVDYILILNRNESIIPAVARLNGDQAAAYFMLGETKGTSAGGAEEAGKALRVPGTNPFFPLLHSQQGNRFLELIHGSTAEVYLMNTGWVGGAEGTELSKKVKIRHSSAVVQAIADGSIEWIRDEDFGYDVAAPIPGFDGEDAALLQPKTYYGDNGKSQEYGSIVAALKKDRVEHLGKFPGLDPQIITAIG